MPDPGTELAAPPQHRDVLVLVPPPRQSSSVPDNNDESASPAMMPLPSVEGADAEENRQKAKQLPCRYCQKRFRRLEHVQRHERTHTKEKPFQCSCGKTFGRRYAF